ncbi:nuclear transport factor 2 family protein [Streptococcus sp.]|uniref:nuclear transport factor 2 family protein n=1 Tax=Streptococcus sp. TaxID=1306 RepID=UPI00359F911E
MVHMIENLSEKIWQAKLANAMEPVKDLIADKAHFVHMGITLDKEGELEAFDSRKFVYQDVQVLEQVLEDFGQTAVIYKKLVLKAVVKGTPVENPFVVTEIFSKTEQGWQLVTECYTRIATELADYRFL